MSDKISIRMAKPADADALLQIYAPYVRHTAITFEYDVPDTDEFAGRITRTLERYPYLVAEKDGMILGYAYASPFKERAAYDWAVETSIYVKQDLRRSGIGRKLHDRLEEILRKQNICSMCACIAYASEEDAYLSNDSVYFHEKLGYRMVGQFQKCGYKFKRWYDMVWMEKHIGVHESDQKPVIPIGELK